MDLQGIVIASLPFLIYIETSDHTQECFNNKTGLCCQDYRNVSGKCEACIGSWGTECRNNCTFGHYGLGCRKMCDCRYPQTCDPKQGCIELFKAHSSSTPYPDPDDLTTKDVSLLVVSGLLMLLLLCILLISYRKMKKRSKLNQRYADGQEIIYDDIRDSRMVDNGGDTSTRVCNLTSNLNGVITPVEKDIMTKEPTYQARIPLRRSRTLGPDGYGHWCRGSDNYNHINFNSLKKLSSYSNVMTNGYDVFKSPKTSTKTKVNDNECDGDKQFKEKIFGNIHGNVFHPTRKSGCMVNRPYSSVKYNRKIRMPEEH